MSGAVDRWHGPTEEERVARGEAQAVRPRIGPAGAMVTFEDAFAPPEINRWLGGFLGAEPAGLGLQRLVFRASRSLAGGSDRMRLHCLRCLWRWERWGRHPDMKVLARRDGPLGRPSWLRTSSQTPTMSRALATWHLLDGIFHRDMADSGRWRPCEGRPLATVRRKSDEGRMQA